MGSFNPILWKHASLEEQGVHDVIDRVYDVRIGPISVKAHSFLKFQSIHGLVPYCLIKW